MTWKRLDDPRRIKRILQHLISRQRNIGVRLEGMDTRFSTKVLRMETDEDDPAGQAAGRLIVETFSPDKGNQAFSSGAGAILEFTAYENHCQFPVQYLGPNEAPPLSAHIVSFPALMEIEEKREEDRSGCELLEMVYVEFDLESGTGKKKTYSLDVLDCSLHGLGILITGEDQELKDRLGVGDVIPHMRFFAEGAMIQVPGTVRHMTRIDAGVHKGDYILGVRSQEMIESGRPVTF